MRDIASSCVVFNSAPTELCVSHTITPPLISTYGHTMSPLQHHASDAEYTLRGCVYNPSTKGFIGRFCESRPFHLVESLQSGAVICPINQVRCTGTV